MPQKPWPPERTLRPLKKTSMSSQWLNASPISAALSGVGRLQVAQRLVAEHHAPAEGVERAVALDHRDLERRVLPLHQQREVQAGGAAADADDLHIRPESTNEVILRLRSDSASAGDRRRTAARIASLGNQHPLAVLELHQLRGPACRSRNGRRRSCCRRCACRPAPWSARSRRAAPTRNSGVPGLPFAPRSAPLQQQPGVEDVGAEGRRLVPVGLLVGGAEVHRDLLGSGCCRAAARPRSPGSAPAGPRPRAADAHEVGVDQRVRAVDLALVAALGQREYGRRRACPRRR